MNVYEPMFLYQRADKYYTTFVAGLVCLIINL